MGKDQEIEQRDAGVQEDTGRSSFERINRKSFVLFSERMKEFGSEQRYFHHGRLVKCGWVGRVGGALSAGSQLGCAYQPTQGIEILKVSLDSKEFEGRAKFSKNQTQSAVPT